MVYLPTFAIKNPLNVGIYAIHGSYGYGKGGKGSVPSNPSQIVPFLTSRGSGSESLN